MTVNLQTINARLVCTLGTVLMLAISPMAAGDIRPQTDLIAQAPTGLASGEKNCEVIVDEQNVRTPPCKTASELTEDVIILQSDGSSEATKLPRPSSAFGSPASMPRPSGIIPTVRRPSSATRSILTGPTPDHSANGAIYTTQKERLFQNVIDRLDDENSEITVVAPSRKGPVAGESSADREINRAQQYQLFDKMRDRIEDADVIIAP